MHNRRPWADSTYHVLRFAYCGPHKREIATFTTTPHVTHSHTSEKIHDSPHLNLRICERTEPKTRASRVVLKCRQRFLLENTGSPSSNDIAVATRTDLGPICLCDQRGRTQHELQHLRTPSAHSFFEPEGFGWFCFVSVEGKIKSSTMCRTSSRG